MIITVKKSYIEITKKRTIPANYVVMPKDKIAYKNTKYSDKYNQMQPVVINSFRKGTTSTGIG